MLRICVTEHCNHACIYCRPGGESCHSNSIKEMGADEIISLTQILVDCGISMVKITGGEPFLRTDILDILRKLRSIEGISHLELITRNTKSIEFIKELEEIGIDCLNFSIDTINAKTFKMICGDDSLTDLLNAVRKAGKSSINLKINMVVMKGINDHEIKDMMRLTGEVGAELKLLDLMDIPNDPNFMQKHYYDFDELTALLSEASIKNEISCPAGGIGTPMPRFQLGNGGTVTIKDSRLGTWYGECCKNCIHYPCQDALMALRLTADGFLQSCLLRSDNMKNLLNTYIVYGEKCARILAMEVLQNFQTAKCSGPIWKP